MIHYAREIREALRRRSQTLGQAVDTCELDEEDGLCYPWIADVADLYPVLSPGDRKHLLSVMEENMLHPDSYVPDLVATGFVEALLNQVDVGKIDETELFEYLGPECRHYYDEWKKFTGG